MALPGNQHRHHTHRLDLEDPSIRGWAATVLQADPDQGIVLDRSAFYPGGGGQPPDLDGIDVQADGGTHVASTAMIGRIAVTKMEGKGRGFRRLRIRIDDA